MKFRDGDALLSLSVIRAEQVAAEEAAEAAAEAAGASTEAGELPDVKEQYVFTITDGGFAKRTRISDYRLQSRGGLGIKAMALANEDRGVLVGAFIVEEGDEVLSITQTGQVVRSPINDQFRATGRSTMGVRFVTPKSGDAVAVVARSVEAKEEEALAEEAGEAIDQAGDQTGDQAGAEAGVEPGVGDGPDADGESAVTGESATIDGTDTTRPDSIGESEA
jgi:DNA gyrase subunit A